MLFRQHQSWLSSVCIASGRADSRRIQVVDVYAAALSTASSKHGNQVKPEDVRTLLVTAYIQCSKGGLYAG
jgi:hypothetical protein